MVSDVKACGDLLLIKCFQYDMPLCVKAIDSDQWEGRDLPRATALKGDLLGFIQIKAF